MIPTFEVNFGLNLIIGFGVKISDDSVVTERCHKFSIVDEKKPASSQYQLMSGKGISKKWLYGYAMSLDRKTVIYPCSRFRCSIPCPCLLCAKQHPRCHVPGLMGCGCSDCIKYFNDHTVFHATFHIECKSCSQLLTMLPTFNFFFLNTERPKFPCGLTDRIKIKPLIVELEPKNPPKDSIKELMMLKRNEDSWCLK